MKRREMLQAMTAGALLTAAPRVRARARRAGTRRFDVDAQNRWSLLGTSMQRAEISVELRGAAPVPLAGLADVRRFRSGQRGREAWNVVGRTGAVEITVRLEDGEQPTIQVSVRGLDAPADLISIHFTGGLAVRQDRAWINGYQSWSACRVAALDARTAATGYWQLALLSGASGRGDGFALTFDADDGGAGEFRFAGRSLDALSRFGHRAVSADHSPAIATLTIVPSSDPLAELGLLDDVGSDALSRAVPAGWCSWYELFERVTEDDVIANVRAARAAFDPASFRFIQLDDGYQRAAGDWETNAKFPHGHRWLTSHIHEAGLQAGLWIAPFAVTAPSGMTTARADWLLLGEDGQPAPMDDQPHWGGRSYALDASLREVQDWLRALARHAVNEWGYDYLKLDFLHYGARGVPRGGVSPHEALRAGLKALREGAGSAYLLGCGAPLQHAFGLFDGMRIGGDVDASWSGIAGAARATCQRAHLSGKAWDNDPDAIVVRSPLSLAEARAWTSIVALSGGVTMASDHLPRLGLDRLELLQRTLPVARVEPRVLDLLQTEPSLAPALVQGSRVIAPLPGRWRFQPGDQAAWSDPGFDDGAWGEIDVGANWERAGHEGLDGFAWYRHTFVAPRRPTGGPLALELGKVDDSDETFLNGVRIGATGTLPPDYRGAWEQWRRYPVPDSAVRWGGTNVVAVRVYDGGGPGGLWSLTRDLPPSRILARAGSDRWMLALVNWEDEPRRESLELAPQGLTGAYAAYDVWAEQRAADVRGRVTVELAPHTATVLALTRLGSRPQVIGSTRHVVQGNDIADEHWDASRRALSGRCTMQDGRPYALTIATPAGLAAKSCRGAAGCAIGRQDKDAVRLEFAATREELSWEVSF